MSPKNFDAIHDNHDFRRAGAAQNAGAALAVAMAGMAALSRELGTWSINDSSEDLSRALRRARDQLVALQQRVGGMVAP